MRNYLILTLHLVFFGGQVLEDEMQRHSTYKMRNTQFWSENPVWRWFSCRQKWKDNIKIGKEVKVKLTLPMPWTNVGVNRGMAPHITTLGTRWISGQYHALTALFPKQNHLTHWTGGLVDPKASLDFWKRAKLLDSAKIQSPACPACSLVTIMPTLSQFLIRMDLKATGWGYGLD
jgi:hypothetical protein